MRYLLIPVGNNLLFQAKVSPGLETGGPRGGRGRDALARTLEPTILTCELLVTYALAVAGKLSRQ